jgi:hypothetical protein
MVPVILASNFYSIKEIASHLQHFKHSPEFAASNFRGWCGRHVPGNPVFG